MKRYFGGAKILFLPFVLGLGVIHAEGVQASEPDLDECNGCSQAQVVTRAEQRYVRDFKNVVILDYVNSAAWQCEVYYEREFMSNFASCQPASSAVQHDFNDVVGWVVSLNASEVEIPYPGGNIHDISGCPACARGWLIDNQHALSNQMNIIDMLAAAGVRLAGRIGVGVASVEASYEGHARVKIKLSNDSSGGREAAYCVGYLSGTELAIDVNKCVDSDGNPIPTLENPSVQTGYLFTSPINHGAMINRLRGIGRRVVLTGTVTVGSPAKIDCNSTECESKEPVDETDGS
jgi:hypothetical protein